MDTHLHIIGAGPRGRRCKRVHHGPNGGKERARDFPCRSVPREFHMVPAFEPRASGPSIDANGLMGYSPVGADSRGIGGYGPVRSAPADRSSAPRPAAARRAGPSTTPPGNRRPVRAVRPDGPPNRSRSAAAARPPVSRPVDRRVRLRLTIALLLTVGAVVLLGTTDESAESAAQASALCTSKVPVADLSPVQSRNARIITGVAAQRGLDREAAEIAVATALAETGLINFANDGSSELYASEIDRPLSDIEREVARRSLDYPHDEVGDNLDSIGLFQQRPTTGWGAPEKLIDPASATGLFYDKLLRIDDWQSGVPWQTAQKVQSSPSANGGIYEASYERAVDVVNALWGQTDCPST